MATKITVTFEDGSVQTWTHEFEDDAVVRTEIEKMIEDERELQRNMNPDYSGMDGYAHAAWADSLTEAQIERYGL